GGSTVDIGSTVKATILDVVKKDRLVDLSLKPELVNRYTENNDSRTPKKMRKRSAQKDLELHQTVNAVVEIVKENYLPSVVTFISERRGRVKVTYISYSKNVTKKLVIATVMALPDALTADRLLLLLKSNSEAVESSSAKRAKKKSSNDVGSSVQAEPLELKLKFGSGLHGRIHITEASDDNVEENPFSNFKIGQTLTAKIVSKAKAENSNNIRWDLSIRPSVLADQTHAFTPQDFNYSIRQSVTGFVYKVDKDWAWITITRDVRAQLYILDTACDPSELQEFQNRFHVGKRVSGYILNTNREKKLLRMLLYPLAGRASVTKDGETVASHICDGAVVGGRISRVLPGVGGLIVQLDPHLSGKVHYTELVDSWISNPLSGYHEGQFVKCKVLDVSRSGTGTVHVDLSLRSSLVEMDGVLSLEPLSKRIEFSLRKTSGMKESNYDVSNFGSLSAGKIISGRVKRIESFGLFITVDQSKMVGLCHVSELPEDHADNIEAKYKIGERVKAKILKIDEERHRISLGMKQSYFNTNTDDETLQNHDSDSMDEDDSELEDQNPDENSQNLHPDMAVEGYVKNVTPKGCFVMLSRKLDAKILISNLSDEFVSKPEEEFPIGKLVNGRVLSLEPLSKRIEVSLRKTSGTKDSNSDVSNFGSLSAGEIISGRVKRIESFGLFITIDQSKMVGLCHVSELPEDHADNIEAKYKIRERVKAKILKIDEERQRISLGMKQSYFNTNTDDETLETHDSDSMDEDDSELEVQNPDEFQEPLISFVNGKHPVLAEVESRASVLPLEVPLDETEDSPMDDTVAQVPEPLDNKPELNENKTRRSKKKEMEEREREIRAAEERLLQKDVPRTADDFEKLIRSSPNSSFIWIKYMAFLLSLNEVEKARSMAERALRTINIREESEKLNVWVAYFNLENEYGNPPE
nr:rRNA biogenesis protein RRP5 [Tanacetum cinerariifolium]